MKTKELNEMPDSDKNRVHSFMDYCAWEGTYWIDVTPADSQCTDIKIGDQAWRVCNYESSADYLTKDSPDVHEVFMDGVIRYHAWRIDVVLKDSDTAQPAHNIQDSSGI